MPKLHNFWTLLICVVMICERSGSINHLVRFFTCPHSLPRPQGQTWLVEDQGPNQMFIMFIWVPYCLWLSEVNMFLYMRYGQNWGKEPILGDGHRWSIHLNGVGNILQGFPMWDGMDGRKKIIHSIYILIPHTMTYNDIRQCVKTLYPWWTSK